MKQLVKWKCPKCGEKSKQPEHVTEMWHNCKGKLTLWKKEE